MKLPTKIIEKKLFADGYRHICAVDEVGMGCLAGPVVVCAVLLNKSFFKKGHKKLYGIRDSKLLSASQREDFTKALFQTPGFNFKIAYSYPRTIDRVNIYQAARLAMRRAVENLTKGTFANAKVPFVLVDGKTEISGLNMEQLAIVKGDRKVFAIACASIVAKVYRDRMMIKYAKKYPQYGFEKHKGYGTRLHQARLAKVGPCEIHRKSFAPVAKLL